MDTSKLQIKRVIVEVKYSGVLGYSRLREQLFDKWAEDFTKIGVNDSSIEVVDSKVGFKVFSEWNRSGLYFENVKDHKYYMKKTGEYLRKLLSHYGRSTLKRIGNRFEFVLPYGGSFDELFRILKANIYKEKIDRLGEIVDLGAIALTAEEGDRKIHISLGPVRKQEITRKNEFDGNADPDVGLFLDIDYYSDIKKEYDIDKFLRAAWKFADTKSRQFVKSITKER